MRKAALIALLALAALPAFGQGYPFPPFPTQKVVNGATTYVAPIQNAAVTICTGTTVPADGSVCSPVAPIYTNAALTITAQNPANSDSNGNVVGIYLAAGSYVVTVQGAGTVAHSWGFSVGGGGGGGGVNNCTTQYAFFYALTIGSSANCDAQLTDNGTLSVGVSASFKGPAPWIDVRQYGARGGLSSGVATTATTVASSSSVTLANASGFVNGDGLVITGAGAAPTPTTPSAPSASVVGPTGTSTVSYECVASDFYEGLTAASAAGTVTNAPYDFGAPAVQVLSYSITSGTATVTFSSAIQAPANSNVHLILAGYGLNLAGIAGLQYATTNADSTQITFATSAPNGSGTPTVNSNTGRPVDGFIITAISRSTAGVISITTDVATNFPVGTAVQIYGVSPSDLDGWYTLATSSGTTLTINTGLNAVGSTETGSLLAGAGQNYGWNVMGLVSWPFLKASCPSNTAVTRYYVYANYGSGFQLIGSTVPWFPGGDLYTEDHYEFEDWGTFVRGGSYMPPPAAGVPSTAPVAAQKDEYVGTISSIAGNVVTVSPAVTSAVSGAKAFYDNSLAIQAADQQAAVSSSSVYFPPGVGSFVWNAPFDLTGGNGNPITWMLAGSITGNDTVYQNVTAWTITNHSLIGGSTLPQFGLNRYVLVGGLGNPVIANERAAEISPLVIQGIYFASSTAGQIGIYDLDAYGNIKDSSFAGNAFGTSVPVVFGASGFLQSASGLNLTGGLPAALNNGSASYQGQPQAFAPLGLLQVRDSSFGGAAMPAFRLSGANTMGARGIEFDSTYGDQPTLVPPWKVENIQTFQAPWTPPVFAFAPAGSPLALLGGTVANITCDSNLQPAFANLGGSYSRINFSGMQACGNYTGPYMRGFSSDGSVGGQNTDASFYAVPACGQMCLWGEIGTQYISRALDLGSSGAGLFFDAPITGFSAVASGAGTWGAGTYPVDIEPVAWNSTVGPYSHTTVTVNGSQGIQVNCTIPAGYEGVLVAINYRGQQAAPITSCPATFAADDFVIGFNYNPTGGPVDVNAGGVYTPLLRIACNSTNCPYKSDVTGTFTANRTVTLPDANTQTSLVGSLTTTAATTDVVTIQGMTTAGHCSLTPTNASADTLLTGTYISAKAANQITITHAATAGATFDILCTAN